MLKARAEMAAIDADDDAQFFAGRKFFEEVRQRAAEAVEIGEVVPLGQAFDIIVHAAAKERDEADGLSLFALCRMKLVQRLQPEQRELDRMFAVDAPREKNGALGSASATRASTRSVAQVACPSGVT